MTERSVVARAMWELHEVGWRLDWVNDWSGGWREFALRHPRASRLLVVHAPPKGWRS